MKIKNISELNAYKENVKNKFALKEPGETKIIVGMATCGIAAGAEPVIGALIREVNSKNLKNVKVAQAGCIGLCQYEPIIEVFEMGKEKVTYVNINAEKALEIINSHIIGGRVVGDYTIGAAILNA